MNTNIFIPVPDSPEVDIPRPIDVHEFANLRCDNPFLPIIGNMAVGNTIFKGRITLKDNIDREAGSVAVVFTVSEVDPTTHTSGEAEVIPAKLLLYSSKENPSDDLGIFLGQPLFFELEDGQQIMTKTETDELRLIVPPALYHLRRPHIRPQVW